MNLLELVNHAEKESQARFAANTTSIVKVEPTHVIVF